MTGGVQRVAAFLPGGRIHPGIDPVGDGEVPWPAHQETRPRIKLPCVVIPCQGSFFAQRVRLRRAMPKIWTWCADATVDAVKSPRLGR